MTNLKSMVSLIVKISYVFTLAPFIFSKNTHKQYIAVRKRVFYIIRIIILILVIEAFYIRVAQQMVTPPKKLNSIIISAVRFGVFYAILPGFPLYLIATYWNSTKMAEFMNNLKLIGMEMKEIGGKLNFRGKYRWHIIQIGFKFLEMAFSETCFIVFASDGSIKQILSSAFYGIPYMLTYLILIQWTSFVNLLTMHFEALNQLLKSLKYRQCFVIEDFVKVKTKPIIEVIEGCGSIYDRLCDESKRLNESYAWQILFLIPHFFLITLSSLYEVLLSFKNDTPLPILLLMNGILCTLYIVEFVMPCAFCKQEASRFSEILNIVDLKLQKNDELEEIVGIMNCFKSFIHNFVFRLQQ